MSVRLSVCLCLYVTHTHTHSLPAFVAVYIGRSSPFHVQVVSNLEDAEIEIVELIATIKQLEEELGLRRKRAQMSKRAPSPANHHHWIPASNHPHDIDHVPPAPIVHHNDHHLTFTAPPKTLGVYIPIDQRAGHIARRKSTRRPKRPSNPACSSTKQTVCLRTKTPSTVQLLIFICQRQ